MNAADAKLWLHCGQIACAREGDRAGERWCLEAYRAVESGRQRRALIQEYADAAYENRRFGTPCSMRDARIQCFIATVLRSVEREVRRTKGGRR